jgi:hypothetical protein
MFGLFNSRRENALKRANEFFKNQFTDLRDWNDAKIGQVLDMAAEIKANSIILDGSGDANIIYSNPSAVSEEKCLAQLEIFDAKMIIWIQDAMVEARLNEGVSPMHSRAREKMRIKRAGLSIWYFSLVAGCFSEFRQNGVILWNELKRGYPHSDLFNPEMDAIKEFASPPNL